MKNWFKNVGKVMGKVLEGGGKWFAEFSATALGSDWSEHHDVFGQTAKAAGKVAHQEIKLWLEPLDTKELYENLARIAPSMPGGKSVIQTMLDEAGRNEGAVMVGGTPWTADTIERLLIKAIGNDWSKLLYLENRAQQGRKFLIADLETLHKSLVRQRLRVTKIMAGNWVRHTAGPRIDRLNTGIRAVADEVQTWAGAKRSPNRETTINHAFNAFQKLTQSTFGVGTRPTNFIVGLKDIIEGIWNSTNLFVQIGLWVFLTMTMGTPVLLLLMALTGVQEAVALAGIVLLIGWFVLTPLLVLCMWQDPLLIPVFMVNNNGRAALRKVLALYGAIIACEFGWGLMMAVVPWTNDFYVLILTLFAVLTLLGCLLAKWKRAATGLGILIAVLVAVLFLGGCSTAKAKLSSMVENTSQNRVGTTASSPPPSTTFTVSSGDGEWTVPLGKVTLVIPAGNGSTHWVARPPMAKKFTITPLSDTSVQREFQETKRYSGEPVYTRKMGDWKPIPFSGLREVDWMPVTRARFTRNPYGETRVVVETI